MKKQLLTLALLAMATVASFAQGTVQFNNGPLARFSLQRANGTVEQVPLTPGLITYGLFFGEAGTSAVSGTPNQPLGANSTVTGGLGQIVVANGLAYQLPGTAAGQSVPIQVRGWSASFGSDWQAASRTPGAFYGETPIQSFVLGPASGPGVTLWSNSQVGKFRALTLIEVVPEPSTIALAVLGLGSLLLFRRRK